MAGASRFDRISKLGEGGMGVVYEAFDRERNMRVALKTLRKVDPASLYRFKREFRALSDLSHPNIIALYELISENDEWYLSMELIDGQDVLSYVRRPNAEQIAAPSTNMSTPGDVTVDTRIIKPPTNGRSEKPSMPFMHTVPDEPVPVNELVDRELLIDVLSQLAQALYALHSQGIVHRDLKPSNVLVTREGRVVLMDFGIVAETQEHRHEDASASIMGTPAYMAPEQATEVPPSAAADWYAFGVLMYQAFTCRLPFRGPRSQILVAKRNYDPISPSEYVTGITDNMESLCMKLLSRDPDRRPQGYDVLTALGVTAENISHLMSEVTFIGLNEFVGRTALLKKLDDAYRQAQEASVFVIVEGASGMGKTTLLRRFMYELEATEIGGAAPIMLAGRCHERESLSYKAFDGVIDQLSRELVELPDHIVASLLPDDIDFLARVFPVLKRISGVNVARSLKLQDLNQQRERAVDALRMLIVNLGEWRPVVLRIEDLQWSDRDSFDVLLGLLRPPAPPRLLLLASRQTDVSTSSDAGVLLEQTLAKATEYVDCRRIEVGPLSENEQTLLVAKLAGEWNLPVNIDPAYWSEADGNPLLLTELARYATEAPGALQDVGRPTLEDVIARRIARLPESAIALLEILVVSGQPTPLWLLAEAADLSDDDRERASSTLRVAKLARVALPGHEPWLNTQHEKIRETVLQGLSAERQSFLHRRLAQALERWDAATVPSLARHWLAAGDRSHAVEYLLSSARAAKDKLAFDRAADVYRILLDTHEDYLDERSTVIRSLGEVLVLAGRYREAADVYLRAAKTVSAAQSLEFSRLAAENLLKGGRIEEGVALLGELMKQFGIPVSRSRGGKLVKTLQRAGMALRGVKYTARSESEIPARDLGRLDTLYAASSSLRMVDYLLGSMVQTQHLRFALQCGEESRICRALANEVAYLSPLGGKHARRAQELSNDVTRRARECSDAMLIGLAHFGVGSIAFFGHQMADAEQAFTASLDALNGVLGVGWERITVQFFSCLSLFHQGHWHTAITRLDRMIEEAGRLGDRYALSLYRSELSVWSHLVRDQPSEAHDDIDASLSGRSGASYHLAHHQAGISRSIVYLYAGRGRAAADVLEHSMSRMSTLMLDDMPFVVCQMLGYQGRAALLLGDYSAVRKLIKRLDKLDTPSAPALARLLDAGLRTCTGDANGAETMINKALDTFRELDCAHMVAACQVRLGELLGGVERECLHAEASRWMQANHIASPERMVALLTWSE